MNTRSIILRIVKAGLVIAACTAWLAFAVYMWRFALYGTPTIPSSLLEPLLKFFHGSNTNGSIKVYIGLAGFVFFAYYATVLLPDLMKRFFPLKGIRLIAFRTVIIVLTCAAAYISLWGCLNASYMPSFLRWLHPGSRISLWMKSANLFMLTGSLLLILWTWLLPVVIRFFKDAPRHHFFCPERTRNVLAFYGILTAIALAVTAASAVLLAILKPLVPNAANTVKGMETSIAVEGSGIFLSLILAPFIEETVFRGLIQHHVKRVLPAQLSIVSIIFASVYFGLWHRNLGQFVYTFLWGMLFGLIYNTSGKVRHTILLHFLGNLFAALSFSTTDKALLGKHVILPAARAWLMRLPLFPAILMLMILAFLLFILMELALYLITGKENLFLRLAKRYGAKWKEN